MEVKYNDTLCREAEPIVLFFLIPLHWAAEGVLEICPKQARKVGHNIWHGGNAVLIALRRIDHWVNASGGGRNTAARVSQTALDTVAEEIQLKAYI